MKVTRVKWCTLRMQHLLTDGHTVETNLFGMLGFRAIRSWDKHTNSPLPAHLNMRHSHCFSSIILF